MIWQQCKRNENTYDPSALLDSGMTRCCVSARSTIPAAVSVAVAFGSADVDATVMVAMQEPLEMQVAESKERARPEKGQESEQEFILDPAAASRNCLIGL